MADNFIPADDDNILPGEAEFIPGQRAAKSLRRIVGEAVSKSEVLDRLNHIGMDNICEAIATGMTLQDIADQANVPFIYLNRWIRRDMTRKIAYEETLAAIAGQMRIEAVKIIDKPLETAIEVAHAKSKADIRLQIAKALDPQERKQTKQRTVLNHKHFVDPSDDPERAVKMKKLMEEAGSSDDVSFHDQMMGKAAGSEDPTADTD